MKGHSRRDIRRRLQEAEDERRRYEFEQDLIDYEYSRNASEGTSFEYDEPVLEKSTSDLSRQLPPDIKLVSILLFIAALMLFMGLVWFVKALVLFELPLDFYIFIGGALIVLFSYPVFYLREKRRHYYGYLEMFGGYLGLMWSAYALPEKSALIGIGLSCFGFVRAYDNIKEGWKKVICTSLHTCILETLKTKYNVDLSGIEELHLRAIDDVSYLRSLESSLSESNTAARFSMNALLLGRNVNEIEKLLGTNATAESNLRK